MIQFMAIGRSGWGGLFSDFVIAYPKTECAKCINHLLWNCYKCVTEACGEVRIEQVAGDRGCDANITAKPYLGKGKDDDVESCYDRELDVDGDRFMMGDRMT